MKIITMNLARLTKLPKSPKLSTASISRRLRQSMCPVFFLKALLALLLTLSGCSGKSPEDESNPSIGKDQIVNLADTYDELGDLDAIKKRGTIRFLIPTNGDDDSYLPRQGFPLHQDVELANIFANRLGLRPEWIFVDHFADNIPLLLAGKGDVITANLTVTKDRKKKILYTVPVAIVKETIVTRLDDNVSQASDLVGRRIAVQKSTSFWQNANILKEKYPGIRIETVDERYTITEILDGVANNTFDVAIADSNIVTEVLAYQSGLKAAFEVSDDQAIAWAVRPSAKNLKKALDRYLSNEKLTKIKQPVYKADLSGIKQRKVLRVLTRNNSATYFLWRGELMGFEYELAHEFAKQQGLRLQMVVPPSRDKLIPWLVAGKGDLIAASLTIDPESEDTSVQSSRRVTTVSEIVVARAGDDSIKSLENLAGRTIYVRPSSSYWRSLLKIKDSGIDFELKPAPENMETEEIIAKVATEEYDLTIADSNILDIELTWRDDIKGTLALGDPVSRGWVVRAEDKELLTAINQFMKNEYRGLYYNLIYQKYFQEPHTIRKHLEERVDRRQGGALSPFDEIVKKHADKNNIDWRLIVSQMYQESRFDTDAKSWAGAQGLMQVLPRTALELGVEDLQDPIQGITAGVIYLASLRDRFEPELSVRDRLWFALAAYNAGMGHVRDARRLAKRQGWQDTRWFDNVEKAMLLLSKSNYAKDAPHGYVRGSEPVKYVREIRDRYLAYLKLTERKK